MDKPERRIMMWEDIVLSHDIPAKNLSGSFILQCWNDAHTTSRSLLRRVTTLLSLQPIFYASIAAMGVVGSPTIHATMSTNLQNFPGPFRKPLMPILRPTRLLPSIMEGMVPRGAVLSRLGSGFIATTTLQMD